MLTIPVQPPNVATQLKNDPQESRPGCFGFGHHQEHDVFPKQRRGRLTPVTEKGVSSNKLLVNRVVQFSYRCFEIRLFKKYFKGFTLEAIFAFTYVGILKYFNLNLKSLVPGFSRFFTIMFFFLYIRWNLVPKFATARVQFWHKT